MKLAASERALLLATLDPRAASHARDLTSVAWPALLRAARASHCLPALASHVLEQPSAPLDAATRDSLRSVLEHTAAHNSLLLAELAHASALLRAARIDHVALKGAVLLAEHYPRITQRPTVDLDLLIDPERFEAAIAALRGAGYVDHPHYTQTLVADGTNLAQAWPSRAHACPPLLSPRGANLDLHHRVPISDFDARGGFRGWLARSHARELHGVSIPMCDRMDLATHLCEHFALQHHADPHDAPKLLMDLRALFPTPPVWPELHNGTRERRISVAVAKALYTAAFERPDARDPATRFLQRVAIADPSVAPWLAELAHLRGHASRFTWNARTRPGYALRTIFPTRAYMAQHHGIDARSAKLYPLYVKRLFATLLRSR